MRQKWSVSHESDGVERKTGTEPGVIPVLKGCYTVLGTHVRANHLDQGYFQSLGNRVKSCFSTNRGYQPVQEMIVFQIHKDLTKFATMD